MLRGHFILLHYRVQGIPIFLATLCSICYILLLQMYSYNKCRDTNKILHWPVTKPSSSTSKSQSVSCYYFVCLRVFFTCGPRSRTLGSRSWRFLPGRRCWVSLKLWTPPSHGPGAYRTKQRPENQSHLYKFVRVYDLVLLFHTLGCIRVKWPIILSFDWIWICLGVHPKL